MAVYVQISQDKFAANLDKAKEGKIKFDLENVRRPFRGIEVREDTYAVIKVIKADGTELALFDAGARDSVVRDDIPSLGRTFNYSNFLMQAAVEQRDEKAQIAETFGEPWIFFYGEKPRVLQVSGTLLNTLDFNWYQEWWRNYNSFLRGTKLAEENARIYLYYDHQIVEGYIMGAQAQRVESQPHLVPFTFSLFVTGHTYLGEAVAAGMYPTAAAVKIDTLDGSVEGALGQANYQSTLDAVRRATKNASANRTTLTSAIAKGIADAEASIAGFMNTVKEYFYGRYMVVPAGIAGSEALVGEATTANRATYMEEMPQRVLPLRSKIADNIDEYVGGGDATPQYNQALTQEAERKAKLKDGYALEKTCMAMMAEKGLRTEQPSKLQRMFSQQGLAGSVTQLGSALDLVGGGVVSVGTFTVGK